MITTPRLVLRPIEASDKNNQAKLFADKEVMRFSDAGPENLDWTSSWVDKAVRDYQKFGYGIMVVMQKDSQEILGYCGLSNDDDIDGQPEVAIGYRLMQNSWGKGFATEAAAELLRYAHDKLGLGRVVATIDPGNAGSRKVAEKIGMTYEKDVMMPGYTHPDQLYVSGSAATT